MGGGGGVVGGVTKGLFGGGGTDTASKGTDYAKDAAKWAEKNVALSAEFAGKVQGTADQFDQMAQDKLDKWENMFGGIEENLGDYFKNLDPVKFATQNKNSLSQHVNNLSQQYTDEMASKGLMSSAMRSQDKKEKNFQLAQGFQQIDLQSEDQVRQMQGQWLNRGDQQEQQALGMMKDSANLLNMGYGAQSSANTGVANAWNGVSNAAMNQAGVENQARGQNMGFVGGLAGAGIGAMAMSDIRLKTNIKQVDIVEGINVYTWDWKEESSQPTKGVIAQEIMYEYPEAVIERTDGYLMVDYSKLPKGVQ